MGTGQGCTFDSAGNSTPAREQSQRYQAWIDSLRGGAVCARKLWKVRMQGTSGQTMLRLQVIRGLHGIDIDLHDTGRRMLGAAFGRYDQDHSGTRKR